MSVPNPMGEPAASTPRMTTRVLVVDDSATIRKVVSSVLERHGFEAVHARHSDVHQHHVGALATGQVHRFLAVGGLADHLEVVGGVDQATFTTSSLAAGTHTVAASYSGSSSFAASTAAPLTQTVNTVTGTLADAGFESPAGGTGSFSDYVYDPTGTPWTFSGSAGNGSGVAGNGSGFTSGNPNAPEGTQVGFLQATGSFSQAVTGMAAGTYQLTFQTAQRGNGNASQQNFQVLVDGNVVGTFTPASSSYASITTAPFTLTAGSHTFAFRGLDSAGGDNTALIDAVQLIA